MAADDFEKTEAPTARKRSEARENGNIPRSQDLTAAVMLLGSIVLLHSMGLRVMGGMRIMLETMLSGAHSANPTRPDDVWVLLMYGARMGAAAAGPLILAIISVGVVVTACQVGFNTSLKPLTPNFGKLSPMKGLSTLLGARGGMKTAMNLLKLAVVATVATMAILSDLPVILHVPEMAINQAFGAGCALVYALGLKLAAMLLVLAILDYAWEKWKHERDLRMSKQEVKEEFKRMEGDPMVKQRRMRVARQLAMQRVAAAVPKADVIVTNPTHFAVALQYESGMRAPKVLAKGADYMAMRIRQLAAVHGVPIVERKELARALYANVEVGQEVPPEHYGAVAEILAYVYRLAGRKSA